MNELGIVTPNEQRAYFAGGGIVRLNSCELSSSNGKYIVKSGKMIYQFDELESAIIGLLSLTADYVAIVDDWREEA